MSEQYIVSARKYRPATFKSVVGQQALTSTLKGAINSGRLAHAYLFCGPRGVGKTSCARIFARTINCLNPTSDGEACGQCESCRSIDKGNSFNLVELDAASNNSVEDIRIITEQVNVPPQVGKYRVFIIDEVHMLSTNAFNAFLKTLEEPPAYAIFILATTEKHKVIPTILSRCQIYDFKRITINDTIQHLAYVAKEEGVQADPRALGVIAGKADGAMRDALSIFDQVVASTQGNLTYEAVVKNLNVLDYDYFFCLVDTFAKGDAPGALLLYKEIRDRGFDSLFFINSLARHIRDLMVAADPRTITLLEVPEDIGNRLTQQAKALPLQWYYAAMKLLNDCDLSYRTSSNKQLLVELTLIRLCQLTAPAQPPFDLSDRKVALRNPSEQDRATPDTSAQSSSSPESAATKTSGPVTTVTLEPNPQYHVQAQSVAHARPRSFRMNRTDTKTSSIERNRKPFSDNDFLKVWNDFIDTNLDRKILISAMRAGKPVREADEQFKILVDHPAMLQAFESAMPKLLAFLRERLMNDYLVVKAEINPDIEIPKFLTPQDFLKKAMDANPQLSDFLKQLDIELA